MSELTASIDAKYDQIYNEEILGLERRMKHDSSFGIQDASGILQNLYIMDGNNWEGRGELQQAALSATIAAYEHFIAELKRTLPV